MSWVPDTQEVAARRRRGAGLLRAHGGEHDPLDVVVLSSFNVDFLPPLLADAYDRAGLAARISTGEFGRVEQAMLDPGSELNAGERDEVLLVVAAEDALAPLYDGVPLSANVADRLVADRLEGLGAAVDVLLERQPRATVRLCTLPGPAAAPHVLAHADAARGQVAVERWLDGVRALEGRSPRVSVVDLAWAVGSGGSARLRDPRLWYVARMRLGLSGLGLLAELVHRHVLADRAAPRKVLALDLDDTVWGGVVGEVGVGGLAVGGEGVGLAFQDLQRRLLALQSSGVLLVACSKNEEEDALAAFERHPDMVLRVEHLAARRVNWQDKATNLRELADELNLGLSSFVFLDDNPVERAWVAEALPEVLAPEMPADPVDRPAWLAEAPWFARRGVTEVDTGRTQSYRAEVGRRGTRSQSSSHEEFLRSLEQVVTIAEVDDITVERAAQLCQKTNQFNVTTRRDSIGDVAAMVVDPACDVLIVSVADRFGDSGTTGVAMLRTRDGVAEIENMLLSCRVLGRGVEDALLHHVAGRARDRGARQLVGRFVPSERNHQAAGFYSRHGFADQGGGVWSLGLRDGLPAAPAHVIVREPAHA
ncbi:MAG: HAD-IIIC family phosphatase [Solirubrobacteraceae bacterium]